MFKPSIVVLSYPARRLELFDTHAGDTVPVHLQHCVASSLVLHDAAGMWNPPQLKKEKARQRLEARIGRSLNSVLAFQLANPGGAIQFDLVGLHAAHHRL